MDKDTIIAVVLGIAMFFLIFAFIGVAGVTGYFYVSSSQGTDTTVKTVDSGSDWKAVDTNKQVHDTNDTNKVAAAVVVVTPPAPVCGNSKKETGEQCEIDADCGAETKMCTACQCVDRPKPEPQKIANLTISEVSFWCFPDFYGKRGIGVRNFTLSNSGTSDFTYSSPMDINAVIAGETIDLVSTKSTFSLKVKAGKTTTVYPSDIDRTAAPYVFLGSKANVPMSIRVNFGETGYVEYTKTLTFQDFWSVGCQ